MTTLIEVTNLSHRFGEKTIFDHISFSVKKGSVVGLLGPSGAGKTTLVSLLTGQLAPNEGSIKIAEAKPKSGAAKTASRRHRISAAKPATGALRTGIMMDNLGLYERLSVWDNLKLFADLYHVPREKISLLLAKTDLSNDAHTPVNRLSKGMRSRVSFCRALLKDIDLLFLDEPTSGLDPATTEKLHGLIREQQKSGTTIFLTTHNMHEAEQLCDHILLLDEGRIIEQGSPKDICQKYNLSNTFHVVLNNGQNLIFENTKDNSGVLAQLMEQERIASIHSSEPDLESIFLRLTGRRLNE